MIKKIQNCQMGDNTMKNEETNINEVVILNTIMNNSQDTFYFKDKDSRIILSSKAHALLWGVEDPNEVIGKTDFDYFPEEFAIQAYEIEKKIMITGEPILGTVEKLVKPDGSIMWLSASKYPLYDNEGNIIGTWGTSRDITSLKKAEEELIFVNKKLEEAYQILKELSVKDSLSGLYNQGCFFEELNKAFELYKRREEICHTNGFSLILFDIDDFKNINDNYGHLMGDYTIRHIGKTILKKIRSSDRCFRYGGDEFAIILYDTELEDARIVAEKLRYAIEISKIKFMNNEIKITVSMGVSSFNEVGKAENMIQRADEKLYISKYEGKNKVS